MTACTKCFKLVDPVTAKENKMKCSCGGRIKKGVDFRISEIADYEKPIHPDFRPEYIHLMPLAELIATIYDKGVTTKTVQKIWQKLIDNFGDEITVLIKASLEEINKIDKDVALTIKAFRNNDIEIKPGGGGQYGKILFEKTVKENSTNNITLDNF